MIKQLIDGKNNEEIDADEEVQHAVDENCQHPHLIPHQARNCGIWMKCHPDREAITKKKP